MVAMLTDDLKQKPDDLRDTLDQYYNVFQDFKNFQNFIIFLTSGGQPFLLVFPTLEAIEEQTLLHVAPHWSS